MNEAQHLSALRGPHFPAATGIRQKRGNSLRAMWRSSPFCDGSVPVFLSLVPGADERILLGSSPVGEAAACGGWASGAACLQSSARAQAKCSARKRQCTEIIGLTKDCSFAGDWLPWGARAIMKWMVPAKLPLVRQFCRDGALRAETVFDRRNSATLHCSC
jgi:hypothetical protein